VKKVLKRLFVHPAKAYISPIVTCVLLVLLVLILRGFSQTINYVDAFTIAGAVTFLLGMLGMVWYFGAFDTFGYSFAALFRDKDKRYGSLYDYSEAKKEKRSKRGLTFMTFMMVGLIAVCIGLLVGIGAYPNR
jgi:putative flippase GtrA